MGRGQAVRRGTLNPVTEGSNPSAPANLTPAEVDAVRLVLQLEPGAAEAKDGAASAEVVEGGREPCHEAGVAERVGADRRPSLVRSVVFAHAASVIQPSKMGW